jgi:hypothetical protein
MMQPLFPRDRIQIDGASFGLMNSQLQEMLNIQDPRRMPMQLVEQGIHYIQLLIDFLTNAGYFLIPAQKPGAVQDV